jgi:hypothetical protein
VKVIRLVDLSWAVSIACMALFIPFPQMRFDTELLKPGQNEMTLTVSGDDLQIGVVWDYLHLELDENLKSHNVASIPVRDLHQQNVKSANRSVMSHLLDLTQGPK